MIDIIIIQINMGGGGTTGPSGGTPWGADLTPPPEIPFPH